LRKKYDNLVDEDVIFKKIVLGLLEVTSINKMGNRSMNIKK